MMSSALFEEPYPPGRRPKHGQRLRLTSYRERQAVSQELDMPGDLTEAAYRRELHDALDRMIFSALAAQRRS